MNSNVIHTDWRAGAFQIPNVAAGAVPIWAKLSYTLFMAVLVPVYWTKYGPSNFLYFCDTALFLTLAGMWLENSLLVSMAAVGILLPQLLWCADFAGHLAHLPLTGMTDYMFDRQRSLFLRGLSFFHGWLPFLLLFLVIRLGYDRRALGIWTLLAWVLMLVSFFLMPPAGAVLPNPQAPVNINYVFGLNDKAPQTLMPAWAWLLVMLTVLLAVIYWPTHLLLVRVCQAPRPAPQS